ncbi:ribbon-helix-helix protein [Rhodophyticola sp.]|jgi:hypothetical protein|uniref:ribbon-helix-helix protein n=1 Tax=Rhodophyticola sp. TaxID=2680032 RepID=UPI003D2B3AAA
MKRGSSNDRFAERPSGADCWVKQADRASKRSQDNAAFTARLTIDITPELRGRIKIAAFQRGITVAEMLRDLLARGFPENDGEPR